MSYETFERRFEGCSHTMRTPLQHDSDQDHDRCFVCHPELRDVPASGKCPACISAAKHKSKGAGR
jgi:hypothetical protein